MTDARVSQVAVEEWTGGGVQGQVSTLGVEQWASSSGVNGQAIVSTFAVEMWAPPVAQVVPVLPLIGGPLTFNIRANEGCAPQPILFWDTVWNESTGYADWAYAPASETYNKGGLQAEHALATAVVLCLMTDRRCPPGHPLAYLIENDDPRGWWGDAVDLRTDLGEAPLGSLLWLLQRAQATPENARWAETFALEALAPLIGQQAVARVDAKATLRPPNRIDLAINLYGRDGTNLYARRFDDLWREELSGPFWGRL